MKKIVISLIPLFIFLIILLLIISSGFRLGEFAGLEAREWLSFWGSLVIPLLLFSAPAITLYLKYKDMMIREEEKKREEDLRDRNEDWDKWLKAYEISKDNPKIAEILIRIHEDYRGEKRTKAQRQLIFMLRGIDIDSNDFAEEGEYSEYLPNQEGSLAASREGVSGGDATADYGSTQTANIEDSVSVPFEEYDKYLPQLVSGSDRNLVKRFFKESEVTPVIQPGTIDRSYTNYTLAFNGTRIGINHVNSKSVDFNFGLGIKGVDCIYKDLVDSVFKGSSIRPQLVLSPAPSVGFLREPIIFDVNNLKDQDFYKAASTLARVLESLKCGHNKEFLEKVKDEYRDGEGKATASSLAESDKAELEKIVNHFRF